MISRSKIRNYKSNKYASRLKNKKRTKMRGGSRKSKNPFAGLTVENNNENNNEKNSLQTSLQKQNTSVVLTENENRNVVPENHTMVKSRRTKKKEKKDQEEKEKKDHEEKINKIIQDKHKCSTLKLIHSLSKNNKSIYKCTTITPYFLYENDVQIYVDNLNPEHTFAVHEYSNQSMNIQYVNTSTGLQKTFNIRLIDLNVDTMQLALNTGSLDIITDTKSNDVYIGFKNFNCLSVNTLSNPFVYTSRNKAAWFDVYEDDTTFSPDKNVFDIINLDGKYMLLQQFLELEEEQSKIPAISDNADLKDIKQQITDLQEKAQTSSKTEIDSIKKQIKEKLEERKEITKTILQKNNKIVFKTNEELFKLFREEIVTILEKIKVLNLDKKNEKEKEKLIDEKRNIENNILYRANIKYVNSDDEESNEQIAENISWAMQNSLWVEKYLELGGKSITNLEMHPILNSEEYKCDLSGLSQNYIIIDDTSCPGYVICGYPEKKMKTIILNFWQDEIYYNKTKTGILNKIHKFQESNNCKYFLDLFNNYKEIKEEKIYNENNLYKIFYKEFDYIIKKYEEIENFKTIFIDNTIKYYKLIAKKYLPKPMTNIKYIFLVLKKNKDKNNNDILIPFIFNVKELSKEHQFILTQIEILIKHELSYRFGILSNDEYNNKNGNKNNPFDNEYKLWYSRYSYGSFFYISTEYVHTMSNIADKAYSYKDSITLEELIYASGLDYEPYNNDQDLHILIKLSFFNKFKIYYGIREHKFYDKINVLEEYEKNIKKYKYETNQECNKYEVGKLNESRSDLVFCLYEKEKKIRNKSVSVDFVNKENKKKTLNKFEDIFTPINISENKINFIVMFKTYQQSYTFIYSYESNFYKLVIESNISKILGQIIDKLKKKVLSNNFEDIAINFTNASKIYKVVSNDIVDTKDYKFIFKYNPVVYFKNKVKYSDAQNNPNIIDASIYYINQMLPNTSNIDIKEQQVFNLFKQIPIIIQNILLDTYYITKIRKIENKNYNHNNEIYYKDTLTNCSKILNCGDAYINYCYYNNDGYDFIEFIDNKDNKLVVYILPTNLNTNLQTKKYLGNILDLDETSLKMLKIFKNIYGKTKNIICFLHQTVNPKFFCIHFQITINNKYKRIYPVEEMGSYMIQDVFIDNIINNIEINKNYYKNYNCAFIRQQ